MTNLIISLGEGRAFCHVENPSFKDQRFKIEYFASFGLHVDVKINFAHFDIQTDMKAFDFYIFLLLSFRLRRRYCSLFFTPPKIKSTVDFQNLIQK